MAIQPATAGTSGGTVQLNCRPQLVSALLFEGDMWSDWYGANRRENRFFVLNIDQVLVDLAVDWTQTKAYFANATIEIAAQTQWVRQYGFNYSSSHTQISPANRHRAKLFGHAAAIIVALELIGRDKNATYNVYDFLRIVQAQYFVDCLDTARLQEVTAHYDSLSDQDRENAFGQNTARLPFDKACLQKVKQPIDGGLITQLASGFCATRYVCELIMDAINTIVPIGLRVGPVCPSLDQNAQSRDTLGRKKAAPGLQVPWRRSRTDLTPCF